MVELAKNAQYSELPTSDPEALAAWFHQGANQGSLAKYLEGFKHTIAVMQTEEALERVAYEKPRTSARTAWFITRLDSPRFFTQRKD